MLESRKCEGYGASTFGWFFGVWIVIIIFLFLLRLGGLLAQNLFGVIFSIWWVDLFVEGFVQFPTRVLCRH